MQHLMRILRVDDSVVLQRTAASISDMSASVSAVTSPVTTHRSDAKGTAVLLFWPEITLKLLISEFVLYGMS